jgi:hypothetical protein
MQEQGYFTTKQAKAAGFAENTHPYHVQASSQGAVALLKH